MSEFSEDIPFPENAQVLARFLGSLSPEEQAIVAPAGEDVYEGFRLLAEHRRSTPSGQAFLQRIHGILEGNKEFFDSLGDQ